MKSQEGKPLKSIGDIKPEDILNYVLLMDIDGVVCEPQQEISEEMSKKINLIHFKNGGNVYYVTGNTYTKAVDLVGYGKIFCNNGDELREDGRLLWRDEVTPPLPVMLCSEEFFDDLAHDSFFYGGMKANNLIEWRSPRFANVCIIGRYATKAQRDNHDASWRDKFISNISGDDVEAAKGGQVSVDIYSKGADKSRAARYINEQLGKPFIFIGDKTEPGGNDFPIVEYVNNSGTQKNNVCLTVRSVKETMEVLDKYFSLIR